MLPIIWLRLAASARVLADWPHNGQCQEKNSNSFGCSVFSSLFISPSSGEEIHSNFLIHKDFHYSGASQIFLKIAYAGKKRRNPLVSFFL